MLRTRSVNVFGMKNAGKSTLVRGIWHVDAAAGAAASTKLDVFNPIPASTFQLYDCGGDDDSAVGDLAGTLRQMCIRSEEHTSELQSLMRISYAVFCLKKKK